MRTVILMVITNNNVSHGCQRLKHSYCLIHNLSCLRDLNIIHTYIHTIVWNTRETGDIYVGEFKYLLLSKIPLGSKLILELNLKKIRNYF